MSDSISNNNDDDNLNKAPILKKTLLMKRDIEKLEAIKKIFAAKEMNKDKVKYIPTICLTFKFHKDLYDENYFSGILDKEEFDKLCEDVSKILYNEFEKYKNSKKLVSSCFTNILVFIIIALTTIIIILTVKSINEIDNNDLLNQKDCNLGTATICDENNNYEEKSFSSLTIIFGCISVLIAVYLIIFKIIRSLGGKKIVLLDELMNNSVNVFLKKYLISIKMLNKFSISYNAQYRFIKFEK